MCVPRMYLCKWPHAQGLENTALHASRQCAPASRPLYCSKLEPRHQLAQVHPTLSLERGEPAGVGVGTKQGRHLGLGHPKKFGTQRGAEGPVTGSTRDVDSLSPPQVSPALQALPRGLNFPGSEDTAWVCVFQATGMRVGQGGKAARAQLGQVEEPPSARSRWWRRLLAAPGSRGVSLKD